MLGVLFLAAGKGERLRPITEKIPKPLVRINDIPIFAFPLYSIVKAGFRRIIVNTHHLADILEGYLMDFGKRNSIEFIFIREKELLGTGGTIKYVFENFGFDEILVVNSDAVGNFDISKFVDDSRRFDSISHIMVYPDSLTGGVYLDDSGVLRISGEGKGGDYVFCGVHIVRRKIVSYLSGDIPLCIVKDGYISALSQGEKISAFVHRGFFSDAGTKERVEKIKKFPREFFESVRAFFSFP